MTVAETYAAGRRILDADAHVMEPRGWLEAHAPTAVGDELPPLHLNDVGLEERLDHAQARIDARAADAADAERSAAEFLSMPRKGWGALGDSDPAERATVLDLLGFEAQLVYPTGSFNQAMAAPERVFLDAVEAMNLGLAEFCATDDRLLSVAYVPFSRGPADALRVIEHAVSVGAHTVAVDAVPPEGGMSPTHPDFDPVWASIVDHDLPVMLHVGLDNGYRPVQASFFDNGRELPHFRSDAPGDALSFLAIGYGAELFIGSMIFDGVLDRHPGLRFGVAELGATWVPSLLHFLDTAERSFRRLQDLSHLSKKPSEYVRTHFCFSPFPGEDVGFVIEAGGPELVMFASDYPHHEGSDDPIRRFDQTMTGVSDAARHAFYHGNFARTLGDRLPAGAR